MGPDLARALLPPGPDLVQTPRLLRGASLQGRAGRPGLGARSVVDGALSGRDLGGERRYWLSLPNRGPWYSSDVLRF